MRNPATVYWNSKGYKTNLQGQVWVSNMGLYDPNPLMGAKKGRAGWVSQWAVYRLVRAKNPTVKQQAVMRAMGLKSDPYVPQSMDKRDFKPKRDINGRILKGLGNSTGIRLKEKRKYNLRMGGVRKASSSSLNPRTIFKRSAR